MGLWEKILQIPITFSECWCFDRQEQQASVQTAKFAEVHFLEAVPVDLRGVGCLHVPGDLGAARQAWANQLLSGGQLAVTHAGPVAEEDGVALGEAGLQQAEQGRL